MARRQGWAPWALGVVVLAVACNGAGEATPVRCIVAGITGGTPRSEYLVLDSRQESAIVQIEAADGANTSYCSGTVVSQDAVLTAAHCLPHGTVDVTVVLEGDADEVGRTISAVQVVLHPTADLALLVLGEAVDEDSGVVPIRVSDSDSDTTSRAGDLIEIAGFGHTQVGGGVRRFAVTRIETMGPDTFTVSADRRAAACDGDSGGPALIRDSSGHVALLGVLSSGSGSCADTDTFVLVGSFTEWLVPNGFQPAEPGVPMADCTQVGGAGRCFQDVALWCEGETAYSQKCENDFGCGYSLTADGFRCVPPDTDPCDGVGDLGECSGNDRLSCVDGHITVAPCAACNATCQFSVHSGKAICNAF